MLVLFFLRHISQQSIVIQNRRSILFIIRSGASAIAAHNNYPICLVLIAGMLETPLPVRLEVSWHCAKIGIIWKKRLSWDKRLIMCVFACVLLVCFKNNEIITGEMCLLKDM